MPYVTPTPASVDERVRSLVAESGGSIRHSSVANALSPRQRAILPVVLASGAYVVEQTESAVVIRLRESA